MKTSLVVLAVCMLLVFSPKSSAQITINQSDYNMNIGQILYASSGSFFQPQPINWAVYWDGSGGGRLWDFTNVAFDFGAYTNTIININAMPRKDLFPGATKAFSFGGFQSWTALSTPTNEMRTYGSVVTYGLNQKDTIFTVYDSPSLTTKFPLTGGSSWISQFSYSRVEEDTLGAWIKTTSVRDSVRWVCDAWGTVKYKTRQSDVIRAKGTRQIVITSTYPSAATTVDTTIVESIQFYSPQYPSGISLTRTENVGPSATTEAFTFWVDYNFVKATTAVTEYADPAIPSGFALRQNIPNPFNPSTKIEYSLSEPAEVNFQIMNVLGQTVVSREFGSRAAGTYQIEWDGKADNGANLPSGVYFYRLSAGNNTQTRKMMLLK